MTYVDSPRPMAGVAKLAMQVFLGLLVLNALIAIAAVLGAAGQSEWKVVGTTLLLTAGCLTIAANAAALERNRLRQLPYVGAALSCFAFAVFIVLTWVTPDSDQNLVLRLTFIALTVGLAATYASLLAIPRLTDVFSHARHVGYATVALIATIVTVAIIVGNGGPAQMYAVLGIVLATASVIVLTGAIVANRSASASAARPAAAARVASALMCPSCGSPIAPHVASGSYRCPRCDLGFHLEITSPRTNS